MIAVEEPTRRKLLSDLLSWIEEHDFPMQVSFRPFCRVHRNTLMQARTTQQGKTHYYCPTCNESLKLSPRVI